MRATCIGRTCFYPFSNTISSEYFFHSFLDYFTSAKYEEITCWPIKPLYDGAVDNLVPFLNRLDIRGHNEGCGSITYVEIQATTYDIIKHFAKTPELMILYEAKFCWSTTTIDKDKHNPQHPIFHSRLLAKLLLCSLTDDFCMRIINRIPTDLRRSFISLDEL